MNGQSRRLAAVWFADIVGFTELSSRDENSALKLIRGFEKVARDEVERCEGTLVKFLGDGALAMFGSTSAALDAAFSLRDVFLESGVEDGSAAQLRIGVHMGDIVVSEAGDVHGDGVNIASRLQSEAEAGTVVVSQDVWRQCRQRVEYGFASLGQRELKGVAEPVDLYAAYRAGEAAPAGRETTPRAPGRSPSPDPRAVAVLPFDNLSRSEETEFLADGLHNDLLTELSRIPELTVISRTSVRAYLATDKPVSTIARELGVGTVLEGSVQSAGERIRLNVQLVDGWRDTQRWAERYDRELTAGSLFDIQNELVERIIESLQTEIVGTRRGPEPKRPTEDLEAFRLAAEGRTRLDQRTEHGMRRALELFESATDRDPAYSVAWVGVADALLLLAAYGYEPAGRIRPRAEKAIRRVLELDPESAEAHQARGLMRLVDRDGPAAVREFERAVELRPGYAEAHNRLSWLHLLLGHPDEALARGRRSVELDPLSPEALCNLSLSHLACGESDQALAEARRAVELSPTYGTARFYEALALYHMSRFEDAAAILEGLDEVWAGAGTQATLALALLASGDREAAREELDRIAGSGDSFALGVVHAALGEIDAAFTAFDRVERPSYWPALAVHFLYDDVWEPRDDPRYQDLVRRVRRSWGLEPEREDTAAARQG